MSNLQDTLKQVYDNYVSKAYKIYDVFIDQFDEQNVDLQDLPVIPETLPEWLISTCESDPDAVQYTLLQYLRSLSSTGTIYVHWPHLRVTNEFDKFTEIDDLWAKVSIRFDGTLVYKFQLNRSSYSYLHISNNYMHSHVSRIPFENFTQFQDPCTGSGPINSTIASLYVKFDEDLWRLFCCELNNYVTVESIAGVPYHKLESLGKSVNTGTNYDTFSMTTVLDYYTRRTFEDRYWKALFKEILNSGKFKFAYSNGTYIIGESKADTTVWMSEIFIKWFNRNSKSFPWTITLNDLLSKGVLNKGIYQGGIIYSTGTDAQRDFASYIGQKVLTFKGQDIVLSIDGPTENLNYSYFLKPHLIDLIVINTLKILNYRYGRYTAKKAASATHSSEMFI